MLAQIVGPTIPKCQPRIRIKESGSRIRIKESGSRVKHGEARVLLPPNPKLSILAGGRYCLPARIVHPPPSPPSWISVTDILPHSTLNPSLSCWEGQNSCASSLLAVVLLVLTQMHQKYSFEHIRQKFFLVSLMAECISLFWQTFVFLVCVNPYLCAIEYPALPTLTGLRAPADRGKLHLHLHSLSMRFFTLLYFRRLTFSFLLFVQPFFCNCIFLLLCFLLSYTYGEVHIPPHIMMMMMIKDKDNVALLVIVTFGAYLYFNKGKNWARPSSPLFLYLPAICTDAVHRLNMSMAQSRCWF